MSVDSNNFMEVLSLAKGTTKVPVFLKTQLIIYPDSELDKEVL